MSNKRLTLISEMIPHIVEKYDGYYNKTAKTDLKTIGLELNALFTDLFGTEYCFDESTYRKTYKNIKEGINLSLKDNFSEEEIMRIAKMRNQLHFEGRIAKKERQEARRIIDRVADNELIKDVLIETINNYDFKEICELQNNKQIDKNGIPIYFYSDVHYGLNTDIFSNKYNEEVAENRLREFFLYVLSDVKKNKYKKIFIVDGADMVEGSCLRISQLVNISQLIVEQSLNYANLIEGFLISLAKEIKDCEINFNIITDSNHTQIRHFNGKPNEFNKEDFALVIANLLDKSFKKSKNVKINFGDIIFNEINGYNIAFIHGHQTMKQANDIEYLNKIYGRQIDCVIKGHLHSFAVRSHNMVLVNDSYKQQFIITSPAVCGNTDYAVSKGYSSAPGALKVKISGNGEVEGIDIIKL